MKSHIFDRIIVCLIFFIITFSGVLIFCELKQERSEMPGQYIEISFDELEKKVKSKENILIQLSLENCITCKEFEKIEKEYILEHNIIIYSYTLDKNDSQYHEKLDIIYEYFPDFKTAPALYWRKNNKNNLLIFDSNDLEENLDKFLNKYNLNERIISLE